MIGAGDCHLEEASFLLQREPDLSEVEGDLGKPHRGGYAKEIHRSHFASLGARRSLPLPTGHKNYGAGKI
jgi:hypothetical protein